MQEQVIYKMTSIAINDQDQAGLLHVLVCNIIE
jgi:hypothetical protein